MSLVQRDLGPRSPWGRFRLAVERFDSLLLDVLARRRADPGDDSMLAVLLEQRDEDGNPPSDRRLRDQLVALLAAGHDTSAASLSWAFERIARHPARAGPAARGRPRLPRRGREGGAAGAARAHDRAAPAPASRSSSPAGGCPAGVHVAACLWLAMRREDLWPEAAAFRPERWLDGARHRRPVMDPVRRRRAPLRRSAIRRDGDARGAAGGRGDLTIAPVRPEPESARRSALVVTPNRGGEIVVERRTPKMGQTPHVARTPALSVASNPTKEAAMPKVSKESATQGGDYGAVLDRFEELEGYTISFVSFREDIDATPLLQGPARRPLPVPPLGLRARRARSRSATPTARRSSRPATPSTSRPATCP